MSPRKPLGWRMGCGLAVLALFSVALILALVALAQGAASEPQAVSISGSGDGGFAGGADAASASDPKTPRRLRLDLQVAQVSLVPGVAGSPLRLESRYDPEEYELEVETTDGPGQPVDRIRFGPRATVGWAMLRAKVSGKAPRLRITLPPDVEYAIEGSIRGGFLALELGGTSTTALDLDLRGGGTKVSVLEPLRGAMSTFAIRARTGSVSVVGLGNASPRSAFVSHHLGALDLDLRGRWNRDASVTVDVGPGTGGTVWLPPGALVSPTDSPAAIVGDRSAESPGAPKVRVSVPDRRSLLVIQ